MGASQSLFGTARAQYHLRQMFVFLNALIMNRPEVMIMQAQNKFDAAGQADRSSHAGHHDPVSGVVP